MPKELTHWIIAERSFNKLDSKSRLYGLIQRYHKEYLGGAVLPDSLLHMFIGPYAKSALTAASSFHNAYANSFDPLIQAEFRCNNVFSEPVLSCLLGVMSHMHADMVFHPYVYALTGLTDIGRHYQLETDMDMYLTSKPAQPPVKKLYELIDAETEQTLVYVAEQLYCNNNELPRHVISESIKLHCRFQSMYGATLWKLAVNVLGKLLGSPYREQRHLFYPVWRKSSRALEAIGASVEWQHPVTEVVMRSTVDSLAEESVARSVDLFRRIEMAGSLAAALADPPGCNLLTGMYGICKSEMFKPHYNKVQCVD